MDIFSLVTWMSMNGRNIYYFIKIEFADSLVPNVWIIWNTRFNVS